MRTPASTFCNFLNSWTPVIGKFICLFNTKINKKRPWMLFFQKNDQVWWNSQHLVPSLCLWSQNCVLMIWLLLLLLLLLLLRLLWRRHWAPLIVKSWTLKSETNFKTNFTFCLGTNGSGQTHSPRWFASLRNFNLHNFSFC